VSEQLNNFDQMYASKTLIKILHIKIILFFVPQKLVLYLISFVRSVEAVTANRQALFLLEDPPHCVVPGGGQGSERTRLSVT